MAYSVRDKNLKTLVRSLGDKWTTKVIDFEPCGYYRIDENHDIEISGAWCLNTTEPVDIYFWESYKGCGAKIIRRCIEVPRNQIREVINYELEDMGFEIV